MPLWLNLKRCSKKTISYELLFLRALLRLGVLNDGVVRDVGDLS